MQAKVFYQREPCSAAVLTQKYDLAHSPWPAYVQVGERVVVAIDTDPTMAPVIRVGICARKEWRIPEGVLVLVVEGDL